jgi:hypothetical protein
MHCVAASCTTNANTPQASDEQQLVRTNPFINQQIDEAHCYVSLCRPSCAILFVTNFTQSSCQQSTDGHNPLHNWAIDDAHFFVRLELCYAHSLTYMQTIEWQQLEWNNPTNFAGIDHAHHLVRWLLHRLPLIVFGILFFSSKILVQK